MRNTFAGAFHETHRKDLSMPSELVPIVLPIVFLYGIVIGSFLNVCIYRIPLGQSVAKERSHCMHCGHQLSWYELIPIVSWLALCGKCRKCKAKISVQYPLIEALNGILYMVIFYVHGFTVTDQTVVTEPITVMIESGIYCLMTSALIVLGVIDERTGEIPIGINIFLLVLGIAEVVLRRDAWLSHVIGMLVVSGFLEILFLLSKGRAIGGGDIKLMATAGLILGWEIIILAFIIGCILGSVIHLTRMKITKTDHVLAFGPYLSAGIWIAAVWGTQLIHFYISMFVLMN